MYLSIDVHDNDLTSQNVVTLIYIKKETNSFQTIENPPPSGIPNALQWFSFITCSFLKICGRMSSTIFYCSDILCLEFFNQTHIM